MYLCCMEKKKRGRPAKPQLWKKYTLKLHAHELMQWVKDNNPHNRDGYIENAILEKASKDGYLKEKQKK